MAILSREKTQDCWWNWLKMNIENTYCFSHLHPGSLGFFFAFLSVQQPLVISWGAESIHWSSEISRKDFWRSPVVPLDSLVAPFMPIHWSALAVGHIWLQKFPFEREWISSTSWELLLIQRAAARKQHVVIVLPDSLAECTVCGDLKTK